MTLNDNTINSYIETLQGETGDLKESLENALDKRERTQILKRHGIIERTIKLLYALKEYNED